MLIWTYSEFKSNTVNQAKDFAANVHTMTLAGLTGMMITGTVGQRAVFLDQIKTTEEIPELFVLRGKAVVDQFGPGADSAKHPDPIEQKVLSSGEPYVQEEGGYLRAVFPAKASHNFLGKDCLMCHVVPEGTLLGLVSMKISLKKSEDAVDLFTLKAVGAALLLMSITLMFSLIFVRRTVSEPLSNACHLLHEIADGKIDQQIVVDRSDETGDLLHSMQSMQQSLKSLVQDVHRMVEAAAKGNFSSRIDLDSQRGFGRDLCGELNHLSQVTQSSLADIVSVADALAKGDLQHRVIKSYPGVFGEAARSINATVEALNEVVSEVRSVVDAAANGQFGITLDEQGKLGYVHTLAGLLNRLTKTSRLALQDILTVADQMSEGNLTVQLENQHPGLFGETGDALNKTVTQLQEIIGQVVSLVDVVLIAANRLADGNRELMHQMREQESGLSAAMRQMGDVAGKLRENALETNKASEMAQTSTVIAEQGSQVVRQTVTTMTDISESSRRIGEIIGVIDGIAFQTNILALNAAVEAARAGEQGRGFAVVATEVRSLAQRSAQAAQEIKSLITESAGKVVIGTQRVNQAGDAMGRIVESIYEMNSLMVDISQMTTRQTEGIDDVVGAVDQVNNMNRQNSQLINSAGDSVVSLVEQAESLRRLMDSFQLNR